MEPFVSHTGRVVPLRRTHVDTDQIIPSRYLKRVERRGFADGLFAAWREDPTFVLGRPEHAGATILVAGSDFGVGSSREHAVWALQEHGFRVVIAPRFGDIFRTNAASCGLLALTVDQDVVDRLWVLAETSPASDVLVDLGSCRLTARDAGLDEEISIDPYLRWRLAEGLDDVDLTLRHGGAIDTYETGRRRSLPTTLPAISPPPVGSTVGPPGVQNA